MNKQDILDRVFGQSPSHREPQQPNEFTAARERELAEKARRIEALRKTRIDRDAALTDLGPGTIRTGPVDRKSKDLAMFLRGLRREAPE
jgi:hypothetical protein